jgi:hypothetical protein
MRSGSPSSRPPYNRLMKRSEAEEAVRQSQGFVSLPAPAAPATPSALISNLERLANLRERGLFSEEEFALQKAKLL